MTKRSLSQNEIFHCFCREISIHLINAGVKPMSEAMAKEIVKMHLGNTITVPLVQEKIAMPTSSYRRSDVDLTQEEIDKGVLSMEGLITKMVIWASTDLSLILISPNEEKLI